MVVLLILYFSSILNDKFLCIIHISSLKSSLFRSIGKDQPVIYAVQTENLETSIITSSPLIVVIGDMFDTTTPLNDPIVKGI